MDDVQARRDDRRIAIDQVGVSNLRYPITVLDQSNEEQETIATLRLSVDLPHHFKGTHMSRFIEILNRYRGEITMRTLPEILNELRMKLEAESARIEVRFPYFLERAAPVTGAKALVDYESWFIGESNGDDSDFVLGVKVPVTSLCPCSKEISEYGAHNQRGFIQIELRTLSDDDGSPNLVWLEELIEIAEQSASAPVYALLKRPDERQVTMAAYDNPVFVEDMVRNVAATLREDPRTRWFAIEAENHESIHNHNAFARLAWSRSSAKTAS